jgi:hypothetical protein
MNVLARRRGVSGFFVCFFLSFCHLELAMCISKDFHWSFILSFERAGGGGVLRWDGHFFLKPLL